jgi:hypothetical protein
VTDAVSAYKAVVIARAEGSAADRALFFETLLKSGEVTRDGLEDRIARAHALAFVYAEVDVAAIGAIKQPGDGYRRDKFHQSHSPASANDYPVELGYVYVDPQFRGHGLSRIVGDSLRPFFADQGCFATSKQSRHFMHRTLTALGFMQSGDAFPSQLENENLLLFLRPPH